MKQIMIVLAMVAAVSAPSSAQFNGCTAGFCSIQTTATPPPTCAATNGQIDMSFCSNSLYVALVI